MINALQKIMRFGDLQLTPFALLDEAQQAFVWQMRTHPDVGRWMTTGSGISLDSHLAYMARQAEDSSNANYLVRDDAGAVGVVSLHRIDAVARSADLGIYRNPFRTEKGLGRRLLAAICEVAFGPANLDIFRLEVAADNFAAISLYDRGGFLPQGSSRENPDLLIMTLARTDWAQHQECPHG